jgi:hypothetical protein
MVLVTTTLPEAAGDLLPPEAGLTELELHIVAAYDDGKGVARNNNLGLRLDLSSLGAPTREIGNSWTFAARVSQAFETRSAAEFLADALERMVIDAGIVDPDLGLATLRRGLLPYEPGRPNPS